MCYHSYMDKERQIRFFYSPLVLIGSLFIGIYYDRTSTIIESIKTNISTEKNAVDNYNCFTRLWIVNSSFGYLIGTITIFLLRLIFFKNNFSYEIWLSNKSYVELGKLILKGCRYYSN